MQDRPRRSFSRLRATCSSSATGRSWRSASTRARSSCAASRSRSARASALGNLGLVSISASTNGRPRLPPRPGSAAAARVDRPQGPGERPPSTRSASTWTPRSPPTAGDSSSTSSEDNDKGDLWIRDFARGTTTRFTFEPELEFDRPSGRRTGSGSPISRAEEELGPLLEGRRRDRRARAAAGERRGQIRDRLVAGRPDLVFSSRGRENWDLWAMPMTGDRKPFPLRKTKFAELNGTPLTRRPLSRVPVERVGPAGDLRAGVPRGEEQVAGLARGWPRALLAGGRPRALLPRPRRQLMAVPVEKGGAFTTGTPQPLFTGALRADQRAKPLSAEPRRPALPGPLTARTARPCRPPSW